MAEVNRRITIAAILAVVVVAFATAMTMPPGGPGMEDAVPAGRAPRIDPGYAGVTIPPNIAPLNFCIEEPGSRYYVAISGSEGGHVDVFGRDGRVVIPRRRWRRLLAENLGGRIVFDIAVRSADGSWRSFDPFVQHVAPEPLDPYLVYRRINPAFVLYVGMSIEQRSVETFDARTVCDNQDRVCMNCHTFVNNRPDRMVLQLRGTPTGPSHGMMLVDGTESVKIDMRNDVVPGIPAYSSWHPGGRAIAFSTNRVTQFWHTARTEVRGVMDLGSDIAVYAFEADVVSGTDALARSDRLETYPSWSPDGRYLYYCSAPVLWEQGEEFPPERYDEVRYDLMRIPFDVESGRWGDAETVLSAEDADGSILMPRISPDGRYLLFCMSDYGCFPVHLFSADLYLMDLQTGEYRRLDTVDSDMSDSWHCWSSNSRWFVFASKRRDSLLARPYFAYVDEEGNCGRPFVLPQEDPRYYDSCLTTFNVPELVTGEIPATAQALQQTVFEGPWTGGEGLPETSATPSRGSGDGLLPWTQPATPERR